MTASETTGPKNDRNGRAPARATTRARRPRAGSAAAAEATAASGADDPTVETLVEPFHGGPSEVALDSAVVAEIEDDPLPDDRFSNRELSWLDFNARVLALAQDPRQKLLERAKFLAIFASNLDEFYMVRVAGLKRRRDMGLSITSADGLTASEQLALISARTRELQEQQGRCFVDEVRPALAEAGIRIVRWNEVDADDRSRLGEYFTAQIFPVLTPLAVDPAHPFPYISGLSLSLAVVVRNPESGSERFARVKVPPNVDRFVQVRRGVYDYLPLEELIAAHLGQLFPGMDVLEHQAFRLTRNADLEVEADREWNRKAIAECESRYEAYKNGDMGSVDALEAIAAPRTRFVK